MHYETFRGRDVTEAVAAVKAAFGSNAIIASTRHVTNGRGGGLGSSFVEVRAAPSPERGPSSSRNPFSRDVAKRPTGTPTPGSVYTSAPPSSRTPRPDAAEPALASELRAVRSLLEELASARRPSQRALSMLHNIGIEGTFANELAGAKGLRGNGEHIRRVLRERIAERLDVAEPPLSKPGAHVIACVGPAGVGKTTTLAKLAAKAHLEGGRGVAVVTLDTFRVGAVEQMRRFMELMGLPFYVASEPRAFERVLSGRRNDLVLVDTPSRAQHDRGAVEMFVDCMRAVDASGRTSDVLLAVPATIRARDVERLSMLYEACPPTGLVITKLDETDQVGGSIHAAVRGPTPLAYFCAGPRVPEDIQDADVEALLDLLLPCNETLTGGAR